MHVCNVTHANIKHISKHIISTHAYIHKLQYMTYIIYIYINIPCLWKFAMCITKFAVVWHNPPLVWYISPILPWHQGHHPWHKILACIGKSPTDMMQCNPTAADWSIGPSTSPYSQNNLGGCWFSMFSNYVLWKHQLSVVWTRSEECFFWLSMLFSRTWESQAGC